MAATIEVRAERLVAGGEAIAHPEGGPIALVEGALPGELVVAEVVRSRRDLTQARVVEVLEPSPFRRAENLVQVRDWFDHFLVKGGTKLPPPPKNRAGR